MKALWLFALISLTGCWQAQSSPPAPPPKIAAPEPDHWMIVPASNGVTPIFAVWRLNTQTGVLSFCYNDNGVKCSHPIPPPVTEADILKYLPPQK